MRFFVLASLLPIVFLTAACSAAPIDPVAGSDAGADDSAVASEAAAPTVHRVEANDFAYQPAKLTIKAGDIVEWVFTAGTHTVTSGKNCTRDNQVNTGTKTSP